MAHEYQQYKGQILGKSNTTGETRQIIVTDDGKLQQQISDSAIAVPTDLQYCNIPDDQPVPVKNVGNLPHIKTATILINENSSNVIDLEGEVIEAIIMPSEWTTASITFSVSVDNINFRPLYYKGTEYTIDTFVDTHLAIDSTPFNSVRFIKVRSGLAGTGVTQLATRVLSVITKAK